MADCVLGCLVCVSAFQHGAQDIFLHAYVTQLHSRSSSSSSSSSSRQDAASAQLTRELPQNLPCLHAAACLCFRRSGLLVQVNIGDGLAWWTDGLLKSTYHRVRAPRGDDPQV